MSASNPAASSGTDALLCPGSGGNDATPPAEDTNTCSSYKEPGPPPPEAKSEVDRQAFLLALYKENCDQARQHENLRERATTLVVTLAGQILTLSAAAVTIAGITGYGMTTTGSVGTGGQGTLDPSHLDLVASFYAILGVFLIGLGLIGRRLSLKHYERNRFHVYEARRYRKALERLFPGSGYSTIRVDPNKDEEYKKKIIEEIGRQHVKLIAGRLSRKWLLFFYFVMCLGIAIAIVPALFTGSLDRVLAGLAHWYAYLKSLAT
jgi:hypothetical protein